MQPEEGAELVAITLKRFRHRTLILAIDGPSAAGTSTLAAAVAVRLGASVVAGDDFYRDMPEAERWELSPIAGVDRYFDWQRLRRSAIEPLRHGRSATYRPFSWLPVGGLADRVVTVATTPIVVIEGVYSARPELADVVDFSVFVDTSADERYRRLVDRGHDNQSWWSRWNAAEDHYFTHVRPPGSFDLIVSGSAR